MISAALTALAPLLVLAPPRGGDPIPDAVILHFNDFHGQLRPLADGSGGAAVLAGFVAQTRAAGRREGFRVLVTDGGDWFQGTPEGNETRGRLPVDLMNRIGVDVAVLGNHEFDFGAARLRDLVTRARRPVLAANLTRRGTEQPCGWTRPFHVFAVRGVRIAVVGLVTRRTPETSTGPFGPNGFGDEIDWLGRVLPRVRSAADEIVLLTHVGVDRDVEIARRFPELRLILGGHSHTSLEHPLRVGRTWIVQTGGKSREVYRVDLAVDPVARRIHVLGAQNLPLDPKRTRPSARIARWVDRATAEIRARWDRPVGKLLGDLAGSRGFVGSTSAGNLVADLIRAEGRARIGIMNKGGIRARLRRGVVTRRMVYELLPFENDVVSMDLSGAELRRVLEEGLTGAGRPFEVSGLRCDIRRTASGPRLAAVRLAGGAELDDAAIYRVATNSFLARGGDGATTFRAGRNRAEHPALLRDLLLDALRSRGPITPPGEMRVRVIAAESRDPGRGQGRPPAAVHR